MITIETWPSEAWPDGTLALKASTFVRHNNKRVDPWFARYVQGKEPPNYPMPAIPLEVQQMQSCWGYPYKIAADIWLRYTDEYNVTGEEIIWPIH